MDINQFQNLSETDKARVNRELSSAIGKHFALQIAGRLAVMYAINRLLKITTD